MCQQKKDVSWSSLWKIGSFNCFFILLMEEILHQLIGRLALFLRGFIHPRWCRNSSINSRNSLFVFFWHPPLSLHFLALFFSGPISRPHGWAGRSWQAEGVRVSRTLGKFPIFVGIGFWWVSVWKGPQKKNSKKPCLLQTKMGNDHVIDLFVQFVLSKATW